MNRQAGAETLLRKVLPVPGRSCGCRCLADDNLVENRNIKGCEVGLHSVEECKAPWRSQTAWTRQIQIHCVKVEC